MNDKSPPAAEPFKGVKGAWYVVILLAISNGVSFFDRGFVALVIDPIKETLQISDTQIGLMIGPAFIIFYSTVSLPIARLADSKNRKHIILAGMFFWSACTAAFGMAKNIFVLGAARMGVGLGEAALVPAGVSIINDLVPRDKIGRAVSMFTAGGILGGGLATLLGGLLMAVLTASGAITLPFLGSVEPWQQAFMIISIPGVILGLVIVFTMREPVRRIAAHQKQALSIGEAGAYIVGRKRAVMCTILGFAMLSALSGVGTWTPTFFMRTYGLSPAQVGASIGLFSLFGGTLGAIFGGSLTDYLRKRGREDANILVAMVAVLVMLPMNVYGFITDSAGVALALAALRTLVLSMAFGVAHPCVSLAAPAAMRSQAVAIYLLCANGIGIGFVPLLVPLLTDFVFHDPMALRYSLLVVSVIATPIIIILLLLARRPFVAHVNGMSAEAVAAARAEAANVIPLPTTNGAPLAPQT
ncbi:MFS transporter [Phenylobacterium immobile]|uniref:MFS transporter n=1 Tax=Phenylobacterium immobile TaxID=21 RepID=UPI000AF882FD|nr:MFS transporter [Phenylobacterium immobile]